MQCYKDMTFCVDTCYNYECNRNKAYVPDNLPEEVMVVSWASFKEYCDYYQPEGVTFDNG